MTSTTRSALIGATLAVVLVAGVAGWLVLRGGVNGASGGSAAPSRVVVVFAMPGEDRAVTAQVVAVVDAATGSFETADTSSTVTIPGTSYTQLRDAYPFGGAKAVATALDGGTLKPGTAWVDVSQAAWERMLAAGVDVTITEPYETFDQVSERYSQFEKGPNHVATADIWGLVNGVAYLAPGERSAIISQVAGASLRELAKASPGQGIETDLTAAQWADVMARVARP